MMGPLAREPEVVGGGAQRPDLRLTLLEIVGYLGAAAALAASSIAIGEHASRSTEILANLATAIVLLLAGWFVGQIGEEAFRRMRSILWFLALEAWVTAAGSTFDELMEPDQLRWIVFLAAIAGAAVALPLWLVERRSLQLIGLFSSLLVAAVALAYTERTVSIFVFSQTVPDLRWAGIVATAFGAAAIGLGWRGIIGPRRTALVLGSIAFGLGPLFVDVEGFGLSPSTLALALALIAAMLLLALGGALAERALAGIGIVGILLMMSLLVGREIDRKGAAIILIVLGLAVVAATILLARAITAESTPASPPPPPAR